MKIKAVTAILLSAVCAVSLSACSDSSSDQANQMNSAVAAANDSQFKSDAASIGSAWKNYYAEVVAGTINSSNPGKVTSDVLSAATASASQKKTAALKCTLGEHLNILGLPT